MCMACAFFEIPCDPIVPLSPRTGSQRVQHLSWSPPALKLNITLLCLSERISKVYIYEPVQMWFRSEYLVKV